MKKLFLLLFFVSLSFAQFKLGIPLNTISKTYSGLVKQLKKEGLIKKYDIKVVKVNLSDKDIVKVKKQVESTDLFFITGSYFKLYMNKIRPDAKTLVLGSKSILDIPEFYKNKLTGVFRLANINNLLDLSRKLPNFNSKVGLLVKKDSPFVMTAKTIVSNAKNNGVQMETLEYKNNKDLESIFKNAKNRLNSIHLFPPSVDKKTMPDVVDLQFKYNLPVISQRKSNVKKGTVFGYVLDYEKILPLLVSYVEKIASGIAIKDLPYLFSENKYMINISSVAKLNLKIDKDFLHNSKIVGFLDKDNKRKQKAPVVKGNYKIAIPNYNTKMYTLYLEKLNDLGYIEGKNLKIVKFDPMDKNCKVPEVDIFFSSGNFAKNIIEIKKRKPFVLLSVNKMIPKAHDHNIASVSRSSIGQLVPMIEHMFPNLSKINVVFKKASIVKKSKDRILRKLKSFKGEINFITYSKIIQLEEKLKNIDKSKEIVLLFPPSIPNSDLKGLINIQNRYKIPIVSQFNHEVNSGIALGISVDFDEATKKLAYKTDQILSGIKASDSTPEYLNAMYYINLRALNKIGLKLPKDILKNSKIIMR